MGVSGRVWGPMAKISLAQDRNLCSTLVNAVMNFQVQQNVGEFKSICKTGNFLRRAQPIQLVCCRV
jgi:hypothetical protein